MYRLRTQEKGKSKLPLKSVKGLIHVEHKEKVSSTAATDSKAAVAVEPAQQIPVESAAEASMDVGGDILEIEENEEEESGASYVVRAKKQEQQKRDIAEISTAVLENPEQNISKVKELRQLCSGAEVKLGSTVSQLAILSAASVFKDIIPG